MFRRNVLVGYGGQQTGQLLRKYLRTHKEKSPPPAADVSLEKTQIVPQSKVYWLPRFVRYRGINKPLELLYSAILESIRELGSVPDMLFISHVRMRELEKHFRQIHQKDFDGYFRFYRGLLLFHIPVMTEDMLPGILSGRIAGDVSQDEVIAVVSGSPPLHFTRPGAS